MRIVTAVSEEDRPAGTTWVFSDGSQVMASSSRLDESLNEAEDKEGACGRTVCTYITAVCPRLGVIPQLYYIYIYIYILYAATHFASLSINCSVFC